ncbi:unnamed protein product, partial [Aphanomyces euteiches]
GIGYETVRILSERFKNQAIVLLGTRSLENGKTAISNLKQSNPSFDYANVGLVEIDVTKPDSIQAAVDFVKETYGNVHLLINNAGVAGQAEGAEACFKVNVYGVSATFTAFQPLLVPGDSSHIVVGTKVGAVALGAMSPNLQDIFENFTALDVEILKHLQQDWLLFAQQKPSLGTWPGLDKTYGAYGVTKAMVMALARKWAAEFPEIKTNVVCPGYCATDLTNNGGLLSAAEGAERVLYPVLNPETTETGKFYAESTEHSFKGLGYEAVRILAECFRDNAIVLLGARSHERGKAALAKIRQSNPSFDYANVHLVQIDVSKLDSIQAAADFDKATYGNVHVLINNAALTTHAEGPEMCFQVNVFGVYDTLNVFYPLLVPHESSNIVVASVAGAWTLAAMSCDLQAIFEDFTALDNATVRGLLNDWLAAYEGKPSKYTWPSPEASTRAYGISKTAVMALTRKWTVEHPDIKTTIVCPG